MKLGNPPSPKALQILIKNKHEFKLDESWQRVDGGFTQSKLHSL